MPKDDHLGLEPCPRLERWRQKVHQGLQAVPHRSTLSGTPLPASPDGVSDKDRPQLAVADGALGFWKALEDVWPNTRAQRCWVHRTANSLNKPPKSL